MWSDAASARRVRGRQPGACTQTGPGAFKRIPYKTIRTRSVVLDLDVLLCPQAQLAAPRQVQSRSSRSYRTLPGALKPWVFASIRWVRISDSTTKTVPNRNGNW